MNGAIINLMMSSMINGAILHGDIHINVRVKICFDKYLGLVGEMAIVGAAWRSVAKSTQSHSVDFGREIGASNASSKRLSASVWHRLSVSLYYIVKTARPMGA